MTVYMDAVACRKGESLCFFPELGFLVSYRVVIGASLCYLIVILALRKFMRFRQPMDLYGALVVYNIFQIVLSAVMTINLSPQLRNNFFNINGRFASDIEFWILIHYCSKYVDMLDTVFIVCRKKDYQLSFLHLYHHCSIGVIWGILLTNGMGNGTAFFGAWINSLVHFLMYSHYLWTSLGFRNPLKFLLTKIQMFQFTLCILHAAFVLLFDDDFGGGWVISQIVYNISLLALFMNFYLNSVRRASVEGKKY
uniref:Elongation of fatty acids protein n=1 Tax=Trypanosoma congolense (strain IL3000) TaxID=1068625 RepID=G0UM93_TRYCI|nr:putative elongation of very long chain fatty acids protein [Trypanosoma congolense IL3000]